MSFKISVIAPTNSRVHQQDSTVSEKRLPSRPQKWKNVLLKQRSLKMIGKSIMPTSLLPNLRRALQWLQTLSDHGPNNVLVKRIN